MSCHCVDMIFIYVIDYDFGQQDLGNYGYEYSQPIIRYCMLSYPTSVFHSIFVIFHSTAGGCNLTIYIHIID